ncbi:hypothetical protein SAPIO_CDS7255 [Scedosporium apiospermum]|uniref:Uncharacterized protein n=1 Tax=Pseudallescheria apiosperma TaxID=563466 RepID=A0A084G1G3_PSEDA|nr:uncharacterized protein SAPIO_CDS7255 [Scedosporium apiospermum]KEZ41175.1 hypothetical protein SAPIO_CDS7255 [Scedosporium apiospermum]
MDYASMTSLVSPLRELGRTIQAGIEEYIAELEKATSGSSSAPKGRQSPIPPHSVFEAQKFLINATGRLNSVLLSPKEQLVLLSAQHLEARALHIIAAADVAGIIERQGAGRGMSIRDLARETGLEEGKLGRLLRLLCDLGIFKEVRGDVFANNDTSVLLARDENFKAWVMTFGLAMFSGANELPTHLLSPDGRGHSYDSSTTALGQCHRFKGGVFQWIGQKVRVEDLKQGRNGVGVTHDWWSSTHPLNGSLNGAGNEKDAGIMKDVNHDMASLESFRSGYPGVYGTLLRDAIKGKADDELVERPEMRVFKMAMVGAGEPGLMAEYDDYPWSSLGEATVVDVGSGVGGFSLRLSKLVPQLNIVLQDLAPLLKEAETVVWPKQHPDAISQRKVRFVPHDFFKPNPVKGADIYYVRNVLLDWVDADVVCILANLKASMGTNSRALIS